MGAPSEEEIAEQIRAELPDPPAQARAPVSFFASQLSRRNPPQHGQARGTGAGHRSTVSSTIFPNRNPNRQRSLIGGSTLG